MKTITLNDVEVKLIADFDDIPVRGNAISSGDAAYDKQIEDAIIERLDNGDVWAWAVITVECTYKGILKAKEYLGCCTYANEDEFKKDGYYEDMINTCLDSLNEQLNKLIEG